MTAKEEPSFWQSVARISVAGLSDAAEASRWWSKLGWLVAVALSAAFATQQVVVFAEDFVQGEPWQTNVFFDSSPDGLDLPNITVCHMSPLNLTAVGEVGPPGNFAHSVYRSLQKMSEAGDYSHIVSRLIRPRVNRTEDWLDDMTAVLLRTGMVDCAGTFVHCVSSSGYVFDCCAAVSPSLSDTSICLTLPSTNSKGVPYRQTKIGVDGALHIHLNPGLEHYNQSQYQDTAGLVMHVGRSKSSVFETPSPVLLAPGTHTLVSMSLNRFTLREQRSMPPYSWTTPSLPCRPPGPMGLLEGEYTQKACQKECAFLSIHRLCGCAPPGALRPGHKHCGVMEAFDCVQRSQANRTAHDGSPLPSLVRADEALRDAAETSACLASCDPACEYFSIEARTTTTHVRGPSLAASYSRLAKAGELSGSPPLDASDAVLVSVFYASDQLRVVQTTQRFPLDNFISQIGGVLGVWSGVTAVTLIQLCVYGAAACRSAVRPRPKRSTTTEHPKVFYYY